MKMDELTIIGYSGHAFVAIEITYAAGYRVSGYFDTIKKAEVLSNCLLPVLMNWKSAMHTFLKKENGLWQSATI